MRLTAMRTRLNKENQQLRTWIDTYYDVLGTFTRKEYSDERGILDAALADAEEDKAELPKKIKQYILDVAREEKIAAEHLKVETDPNTKTDIESPKDETTHRREEIVQPTPSTKHLRTFLLTKYNEMDAGKIIKALTSEENNLYQTLKLSPSYTKIMEDSYKGAVGTATASMGLMVAILTPTFFAGSRAHENFVQNNPELEPINRTSLAIQLGAYCTAAV